ncbi:MAG: hypothetical protein JSR44_11330 [Spirochaetes bacterium]|nr:hypothetical protein [Spirochaetota bacterium]
MLLPILSPCINDKELWAFNISTAKGEYEIALKASEKIFDRFYSLSFYEKIIYYQILSNLYSGIGEFQKSLNAARAAIKLDPKEYYNFVLSAMANQAMHKIPEALHDYEAAIAILKSDLNNTTQEHDLQIKEDLSNDAERLVILLQSKAHLLREMRKFSEASTAYEEAATYSEEETEIADLLHDSGAMLMELSSFRQATHRFIAALHIEPKNELFGYSLALAAYKLNKRQIAIKILLSNLNDVNLLNRFKELGEFDSGFVSSVLQRTTIKSSHD